MNHILFILVFTIFGNSVFAQGNSVDIQRIQNYVRFLDSTEYSAKEYILKQFEKYDIVILAERYHTEETQYQLINDVIKDKYFISNVGNICIEIGSENLSDSLNNFLKYYDSDLQEGINKLFDFQRDISFYPLWNRENYHDFLKNILCLNMSLEPDNRIHLFLCDRPFDWSMIKNKKDWEKAINNDRDSLMARNISKHYESIKKTSRKKLLVILNEAHAITNPGWTDMWQKRAGQYLAEKYGRENIASICINSVKTNMNDEDELIQEGYWDAAFSIVEKNDLGFNFKGSPFGTDTFDYAIGKNNDLFQYKNIFTGFVFYKPLEQHKLSIGVNNIVTDDFRDEFLRRIKICNGNKYYGKLKDDNVLLGWNEKEYYQYDNFNKMLKKIQRIKTRYLQMKKN